jgi:hypothetical protein
VGEGLAGKRKPPENSGTITFSDYSPKSHQLWRVQRQQVRSHRNTKLKIKQIFAPNNRYVASGSV